MSEQNISSVIPIKGNQIDGEATQTVDARDLHTFLNIDTPFKDWFHRRVKKYGFIKDLDFCSNLRESSGGRPSVDYFISLDMAKELAMVESNDQGREARRYFIECERRAKQIDHHDDPIIVMRINQIEMEKRVTRLEVNQARMVGPEHMSVLAYCNTHGLRLTGQEIQSIGIRLSSYCKNHGYERKQIPDNRFGTVRAYPVEVMNEWFIENHYLNEIDTKKASG